MFLPDAVLDHVEAVSEAPDLSGTRYVLGELLGRGGLGSVWKVHDRELDRDVALKVVERALSPEAKVIAQLEHPGIVPVHDSGTLPDGRAFYVMKLVRGQRLDHWAKGRDVREKLRLFQRVCEAVAFAHARGVVHRDLKPENVMVGEFGEALVMDWGVAGVLGTPAYLAPEVARGEAAGPASDVYGLGALLHALLGGRPPYEGASAQDVVAAVARGDAPHALEAPAPLRAVVTKAMSSRRYPSPLELSADVEHWLAQEPVSAYPEPLPEKLVRFASKNSVVLSLLAAYLVLRLLLFALQ